MRPPLFSRTRAETARRDAPIRRGGPGVRGGRSRWSMPAAADAVRRRPSAWRAAAPIGILAGLLLLWCGGAGRALAEDSPGGSRGAAPEAEPKPRSSRGGARSRPADDGPAGPQPGNAGVDPDSAEARGEKVLAFVRAQSPELAAVLGHLARRNPADYEAAIDDLSGTIAKLAAALEKDPALHAIELELWRTRTRVELLGARLVTGSEHERAGLEARLREAVAAELEAKAAHLAYRRQRSMAWYDRQLDRLRDERDDLVESRVRSLMRGQAPK